MPRLKRRSCFTTKPRKTPTPGTKGRGRWPVRPLVTMAENNEDKEDQPFPSNEKEEEIEEDMEEDEVEVETRLPMMYCVVCYNEFTSYTLNCISWETAMTKDFYVALSIPSGGQDDESIVSLPFCPECHSKVSVMFSVHQQLQSILQNFNCARNDLAFTIVETIDKNCRNGPLDLIRKQIFERWKDLHKSAKEKQTSDIFEGETDEYLDPSLTVIQDWPADHKSMALAVARKNKTSLQVKEVEQIDNKDNASDSTSTSSISPVKTQKSPFKKGFEITALKSKESKGAVKKILKGKGGGKERNPEMPKLVPMGKLPTKSKSAISSFRKTLKERKINGTSFSISTVPSKSAMLKQSTKGKLQLLKKQTSSSKARTLLKTLGNKKTKHLTKKAPVQLADGNWKCPYCPKTYPDLPRVRRHESMYHPHTRPLVCHLCPNGFSSSLTLRRHLQVVHHQAIEGFAKCPYCEKSFGKKHAFELHIRSFHKGKTIPEYRYLPPGHPTIAVKIPMVSPPSPEITDLESLPSSSPDTSNAKRKLPSSSLKKKVITETTVFKKREKSEVLTKIEKNMSHGSTEDETESVDLSDIDKTLNKYLGTEALLKNQNNLSPEISTNNKCTTCDEDFSLESDLREHRLELHGQVGATCPICNKWYPKHQSLGGHMHLHRREGITWKKTGNGSSKGRKSIVNVAVT